MQQTQTILGMDGPNHLVDVGLHEPVRPQPEVIRAIKHEDGSMFAAWTAVHSLVALGLLLALPAVKHPDRPVPAGIGHNPR